MNQTGTTELHALFYLAGRVFNPSTPQDWHAASFGRQSRFFIEKRGFAWFARWVQCKCKVADANPRF